MYLYLMRHGIALAQDSPEIASDQARPLTQKGIKRMRRAAKGLGVLKLSPDLLLTSPYLRARQTAEIVAGALEMAAELQDLAELAPGTPVATLIAALSPYRDRESLLLLGHQPLLGEAVSFLVSKNDALEVPLKRGGLCCVEVTDPSLKASGVLRWMLTPRQLRLLAGA